MEFLNWKNTLLEWANRLEFLGRPYYSLNLVDIETFFNEFKAKVKLVDITSMELATFIKRYYPEFHAKYNEDGKVCPEDYIYGYSLLMHFSCVLHPDSQFQNICKDMQEETQLTIRTFLQNLIDRKSFSRETIKSVIESSAPAKLSDYVLVLSPVKTTEIEICPPTPRTKMLNDWNFENRQLKAQVESERFEKGFMEVQLKKQEQHINTLTQERRKFEVEIQDLKSKLSEKDLENIPPNKILESDVLKRRLRKEIEQKDATITEMQQKIDDLIDARERLSGKIGYVESQYKKSIESTNYLNAKLEELTGESEKKLQHIEGLEITIKEYQKYINGMNSKAPSLDTSCDNLDDSYALAMANLSKTSMSSPETLGTVVDIQLREKIALYDKLLDQYNQLKEEEGKLNNHIADLIEKTDSLELKCRQIENENLSNIKKYDEKLQKIADLSKEAESNMKNLQLLRVELDTLSSKNAFLENQLQGCEQEIVVLKANNKTIAAENADHLHQIERLTSNRDDLTIELENCKGTINIFESSVQRLQEQIKQSDESEAMLKSEAERLAKLLDDQRSQIDCLEREKQTLIEDYKVSLENKTVELQQLEQERNTLTAELKQQATSVSDLTARIATAEADLLAAETLKIDLVAQYQELQLQSDTRLGEVEKERDSLSIDVKNLTASLHDEEALKIKLLAQNKELTLEKETVLQQVEKEKNELSLKVSHLSEELVTVKSSLAQAETVQKELKIVNEELTQEITSKTSELETLIKESGDTKDERNKLNAKIVSLTNQLETLREQHKTIDSTLNDLTTANEFIKSESKQLREQIESMTVVRSDLESQLNQCEEEKEKLFLTLQEKIDDAEVIELNFKEVSNRNKAIEALKCKLLLEKNDLANDLKSNHTIYESKVNELQKNVCDLTACNQNLVDTNNILSQEIDGKRENLTKLQSELEILSKNAEQKSIDNIQFLDTIEQLKSSKSAIEEELNESRAKFSQNLNMNAQLSDKYILLEQRLKKTETEYKELEINLNDLEKEKVNLKKCGEDLKIERDELKIRVDSAERQLICSQDAVKMKNEEVDDLQNKIHQLETDAEAILIEKSTLQSNLSENRNVVVELTKELERNRTELLEKEKSINSLSDQIEDLKKIESANLESSKNINAQLSDKCILLEQRLKKTENEYKELEINLNDLEIEKVNLKKCGEDLKIERDELKIRVDSAERELICSQDAVKMKNEEVDDLLAQIRQLKTDSEAILIEKSTLQSDLNENRDLVVELTKELERNRTDVLEKEKSMNILVDQIEDLKKTELANVESSKLIAEIELEKMKQQMCEQAEITNHQMAEVKLELEMSKEQIAAATMRSEEMELQNSAEMKNLEQTIKTLDVENKSLVSVNNELTQQVQQLKLNRESYQQSANAIDFKTEIEQLSKDKTALSLRVDDLLSEVEKMREDLEKAKSENMCLTDDNVDLATEIDKVRSEYLAIEVSKKQEIHSLQSEIKKLQATISENHSQFEELQRNHDAVPKDTSTNNESAKVEADLKIALSDLESKILECKQAEEREMTWMNDNKILSAKLTKHREMTQRKDEEWAKEKASLLDRTENKIKETRLELEGKLEKMKARMKHIYTEETSKVKEKHERELVQVKNENLVILDKYDIHNRTMSKQIYKLNDQHLQLQKENEFLKNKLRLAENTPRDNRVFTGNFGSNLKMEDEEGEIFNNTYLTDLKSGVCRTSPTGRESIRLSELQIRNSLAPRHLRSTYAAQYGDQNLREEDISMPYFNDSMFSNQLDVRRGTLYQRPGPPTPSKNGGRLSFGSNVTASDLFPKEVLREQNNNTKTKTTPGKLMSMFSSSKPKVEAVQRKSIARPIYSTFTSTPHQKAKWARQRRLTLLNAPITNQLIEIDTCVINRVHNVDEDTTSTNSENSLLSKSRSKIPSRKSVGRRFSIISKQRNGSFWKGVLHKNRHEYREKNHSKRLKGFELSRGAFLNIGSSSEDDIFQSNNEPSNLLSTEYLDQMFPLEFACSEKFEVLARHTTSEHPYSNEPTTIEPNENSLLSSSVSHSKTMFSNNFIHGKIPKITVNPTPQRECIQSRHRSARFWFGNMDFFVKTILITIFIVFCVPCAIYAMSHLFIRKNS